MRGLEVGREGGFVRVGEWPKSDDIEHVKRVSGIR
jgi:hypothetical protein